MIILPEFQKPYLLETTTSAIVAKYYWAFSATMLDYTILPLNYLEETTGVAIKLDINGFECLVPYNWHILISDPDTLSLDYIPIRECATIQSYALTMTPIDGKFRLLDIKITGVEDCVSIVHPLMPKSIALCHPVAEIETDLKQKTIQNIVIGPHDIYKHLSGKLYGDII